VTNLSARSRTQLRRNKSWDVAGCCKPGRSIACVQFRPSCLTKRLHGRTRQV